MAERNTVDMGSGCGIPLVASDLPAFDTTPDGVLYLNELAGDKLDCFVDRYIHTDRDVRRAFLPAMSEEFRGVVRKMVRVAAGRDHLATTVQRNISEILEYELPDREWRWSTGTSFDTTNEAETAGALSTTKVTRTLLGYGGVTAILPFSGWTSVSDLKLEGDAYWEAQSTDQSGVAESADYRFGHTKLTGGTKVLAPKDRGEVGGNAVWTHVFDAPPDHTIDDLVVNGLARLRDLSLLGHPLSIEGAVTYLKKTAEPPPETTGFYTIHLDNVTVKGLATYGLNNGGLLLDYNFVLDDSAEHYVERASSAHNASALMQFSGAQNDYVRVGAGGGAKKSRYTILGEPERAGEEADGHLRVEGQAQLHPIVRLQGSTKVVAKRGEGIFEGWYPAWNAALALSVNPPQWTINCSGTYAGHTIDLNNTQESHTVGVIADVVYASVDWMKVTAHGEYTYEGVKDFEEHRLDKGKINTVVAFGLPAWKALWFGAYAGGVWYKYDAPEFLVDGHVWWAGAFVDISQ